MITNPSVPLHQRLFLLAHEADGRPRVHAASLHLALAGTVLAELAITERIRVRDDRFVVFAVTAPHADPLTAAVQAAMLRNGHTRTLSHWIRTLSADIHDRVAGGLLAAGLVTRDTRRRRGGSDPGQYPHLDTNLDQQLLSVLRYATHSRDVPDPATLAMCGFFGVLRLDGLFRFATPAAEVLDRLRTLLRMADVGVQEIVLRTEQLIGDTAMSAYR